MRVKEWNPRPIDVVLGTTAACLLDYFFGSRHVAVPGEPTKALLQVGLFVLAGVLSYVAGRLLAKKVKTPFDDKPTSLAQRGAFLSRVIGRRRVGVLMGWAGLRSTRKEKVDGGKGLLTGGGQKQTVYIEDGWQQICVGPATALHKIYQNGTVIFEGPITSVSHPSGSTIDLGKEGVFRIFWGELDQPINTYLGDSTRVGVNSRWPATCYIEWRGKRLGTSATWPLLEYEIEVRTQGVVLTDTDAYMEPTRALTGATESIASAVAGIAGVGYFQFTDDVSDSFEPFQLAHLLSHTGMSDQDVRISKVDVVLQPTAIGFWPDGSIKYSFATVTRVYVDVIVAGTSGTGTLQAYADEPDDGINPAHIIAELLFDTTGYGLGFDTERWDLDSLEEMGTRCETEGIKGSILAQDGIEFRSVIGGMLVDLGYMLTADPTTGKLTFVAIRQPVGDLETIQAALQTDLPEIEVQHGPKAADQTIFSFSDRENAYHDMTLGQDDDGQIVFFSHSRAQTAQIISTVNFGSANVITERRALETLAGGAKFTLKANRACRYLRPGSAFYASGFDDILRLLEVEQDALSGEVSLQVVPDYYGAEESEFVQQQGNTGTAATPAASDRQFAIVEVPEFLLAVGEGQALLIPRVRASTSIAGADLHLSRDNSTYVQEGRDQSLMTGGVFIGSLSATGMFDDTSSPQVTIAIDASSAVDLSADATSWCNGRQLLVMVDSSGNQEIAFLKKITIVSGTTYTLDGILRARYDTQRLAITAGCKFYILQNDDGAAIQDVLLEPEVAVYVKTQPFGNGQVLLSQVTPAAVSLYGKGVRPIPICNLRMGTGDSSYLNAANVTVKWAYSTPRTLGSGAGLQGAGNAASEVAPEGEFRVEYLTGAGTLVRTETMADNEFVYTAAQRVTDFGSDPASLKIRVTQLRGGFAADPVTATFTKVS